MTLADTGRQVARLTAPVLYAAGLVPVIVGSVVVVTSAGRTIGWVNSITFRYNGDVAAAASVLVIGGIVFGFLSRFLMWIEGLREPTVMDHLRYCLALYVILALLAGYSVKMYENWATYGMSLGDGLGVACLFAALYAISVNALVLFRHRRRFASTRSGGTA